MTQPHRVRRSILLIDRTLPAPILKTWTEPVGEHVCIGGWQL